MKKLLLFLMFLATPSYAIESAVIGTMLKQEGTKVLPADDVTELDVSGIICTGCGGGVSEGSDVGFGNITATSVSATNVYVGSPEIRLYNYSNGLGIRYNSSTIAIRPETNEIEAASASTFNIKQQTDQAVRVGSRGGVNGTSTYLGSLTNTIGAGEHNNATEINTTYTLSDDASFNNIFVNISTSGSSTGEKNFIKFADDNVDKFRVDANGSLDVGGAIAFSGISTATADYVIGSFEDDPTFFIECDATLGNVSTTLPLVADKKGRLLEVKLVSAANGCYLDGNGAETIDGVTGQAITIQYNAISLIAGSSEWLIY